MYIHVGFWEVTLAWPIGELPTSYNNLQDGLELQVLGLLD
jgi:hypothetical protein